MTHEQTFLYVCGCLIVIKIIWDAYDWGNR